ncbi:hypothetical protein CQW23_16584 [Capsicum baccatum]|uniref:Uncharacterized protein n=1 Tax=Capsicum baccatum TaxID=33114 RepID=A0A2G2WBK7_CAPBA|nr:hypothetical protein CQW23_16584 [Capsicum baccatum]
MNSENFFSQIAPPVFDSENYHLWDVRMETYFEALDIWEAVDEDYEAQEQRMLMRQDGMVEGALTTNHKTHKTQSKGERRKSAMRDKEVKTRMKRGFWKPAEDLILKNCVETHGEGIWATISEKSGLLRSGKNCRLRWSLIAGRLPGRTDNEVKNFWNTHLNKKRSCRVKKEHVKSKEANTLSPKEKMQEYPAETVSNQEVATKKVLDSWIEEMQDFNCSLLSPLSMNNMPSFYSHIGRHCLA